MKIARKATKSLALFTIVALTLVFGWFLKIEPRVTFAEGEAETKVGAEARFVTFYDNGEKLTVKTEAETVEEAINRAGIIVNNGDIVEPSLESEINRNNFFVNIYRARPVIVKDGAIEKYLMTASYDYQTIAKEAGLTLYDGDEMELVANTNFLESGVANVYRIHRNGGRTLTIDEEIPFVEQTIKDGALAPGMSEVRQLGEVGTKRIYYNVLYVDGVEVSREQVGEEVIREPVARIVAVGVSLIEQRPLTSGMGVNIYTVEVNGVVVTRKETFYDLPMSGVMRACGGGSYSVRPDGAKVDQDGYVLVAAHLGRYPRCSIVETSLGPGKVYDTGGFAAGNPEQFDLATDWSSQDGI